MLNSKCFITFLLILPAFLPSSLLAQTSITDSEGTQHFSQPPQRIIALSWELAEQLIELEIPLLGVADTSGYREWVVKPALANTVEDLGGRAEPNLEKIARLQPDLIVINSLQKGLTKRLKNIAPVLTFNAFSKEHNNPQMAIQIFNQLAVLFEKEQLAEQKLSQMQQHFKQLSTQLKQAYHGKLPDVTTLRFANTSSVYIYGDNSMSQYALSQLGIKNPLKIAHTQWGLVQKRVLDLSKIKSGSILFFEPFPQWQQLQSSRLWQAMPAVKAQKIGAVKSTWTYGGAMSLKYLAQAMTDSLLSIAPSSSLQKSQFNNKPSNKTNDVDSLAKGDSLK